jgi:hypothetical protein
VLPPQLAEGVQHVSHGQQFFLHLLPLPRGQYGDPVDVVPPPSLPLPSPLPLPASFAFALAFTEGMGAKGCRGMHRPR